MCRGQRVAAEGMRVRGRWWQEPHHGRVLPAAPHMEGDGAGQASHYVWGWGLLVRALSPVPHQLLGTCKSPEGSGPSGSAALLLTLPGLRALALALPGASCHSDSRVWHPLPFPSLHSPGISVCAPAAGWFQLVVSPHPGWQRSPCRGGGGAPCGCSPGGVGCSPPSEDRAHWAGGLAAGCPPASQSQRFLVVVVVYL